MAETVQSIVDYCRENGRVCPQPLIWQKLYELLPDKKQLDRGWEPPLPLILGAWQEPALPKMLRLIEHIEWAAKKGCLDEVGTFLRCLDERNWFHTHERNDK